METPTDRFEPIDLETLTRKADGLTNSNGHFVLLADDTRGEDRFALAARQDLQVLLRSMRLSPKSGLIGALLRRVGVLTR